ncbi:MAG: cupredoxin domain-containing protein [Kouleothrix sp.]|nr:cupredoxin domain-containing protein [Kouleothrix sp.]
MVATRGRIVALLLTVLLMVLFHPLALAQGVTVTATNNPTLGTILTDSQGKTLYAFLKDTPNVSSACYDRCATTWPPLLIAEGNPVAGEGVNGNLLGVLVRTDGNRQVMYNGMPLYYFATDANPGDTKGQGVGKVWFVMNLDAAGTPAPLPAAPAPAAPASAAPAPAAPAPATKNISIKDNAFDPKTITVNVGDTLTWTIAGQNEHTVTADGGTFDSDDLKAGEKTTFSVTFTKAGTFAYYCQYHGGAGGIGMSGTVVVQAAGAANAPAELPRTGGTESPLSLLILIAVALLTIGLLFVVRGQRRTA